MRFLVFYFSIFSTLVLPALDSSKVSKRLATLEILYQNGTYRECIKNAADLQVSAIDPDQKVVAQLWQAKSNFAITEFDKAQQLADLAEQSEDGKPLSTASKVNLAEYYLETGDVNRSSTFLASVDSARIETERIRFLLVKSRMHIERMELKNARAVLLELQTLLPALNGKDKKHYTANWYNLQDLQLIRNGNLLEAKTSIQKHLQWYEGEASEEFVFRSELLEMLAEYCLSREDYAGAFDAFSKSYATLISTDYHLRKIYLLSRLSSLAVVLGKQNDFAAFQRRLQLHAGRSIYKTNLFQLGYKISEAHALYAQFRYSEASALISKLQLQYKLPAQHPFECWMSGFSQMMLLEQMRVSAFLRIQDSVSSRIKTFNDRSRLLSEAMFNKAEWTIRSGNAVDERLRSYLEKQYKEADTVSIIYYDAVRLLANFKFKSDRIKEAYFCQQQAHASAEVLFGKESWEFITCGYSTAELAYWAGDYKAVTKFLQMVPTYENNLKVLSNRKQLELFYSAVSGLSRKMGDQEMVSVYGQKSRRKSTRRILRDLSADLEVQEQSAEVFIDYASFFVADRLLQHSLQQRHSAIGTQHSSCLRILRAQTAIALGNGDLGLADRKITEYLSLSRQLYGESSLLYAEGLEVQASYVASVGDLQAAITILKNCIRIKSDLLGSAHLSMVEDYSTLALLQSQLGAQYFTEAEELYKKAGEAIVSSIGSETFIYYKFLLSFAGFQLTVGQYSSSLQNLQKVEQYLKLNKSPGLLNALLELQFGHLYYATEKYTEARLRYERAADQYQYVYSKRHPLYCNAMSFAARSMYMLKQEEDALSTMKNIIPVYLDFIEQHFPSLSFDEKSRYWNAMKEQFDFFNFMCIASKQNTPELNALVYNNILRTKALLLSSDIKLRKQIADSKDSVLISLFSDWIAAKQELVLALSLSKEEQKNFGTDPEKLQQDLTVLEKSISARSALFGSNSKKEIPDWNLVRQKLNAKEYAVELLRTRHFDKKFTDSVYYVALILSQSETKGPQKVVMADGKKMETRFYNYYQNAIKYSRLDEVAHTVYWKELGHSIPVNSVVYLSTDGVYNQINVELLYNPESKRFVFDEYNIVQISNSRDLLRNDNVNKNFKSGTYILCGNPVFYLKSQGSIASLPGTEKEVEGIKRILERDKVPVSLATNAQVTEEYVTSVKSPVVLHIATHGYFYQNKSGITNDGISTNPLLYSGILLSGAGDILSQKGFSFVNSTGGILTAYEAVNMSLDGTEMVVLSACETGKGTVQDGEGVMGLQRSFLVAGASSVVVSQFKVNDEITNELMQEFYSAWIAGNTKREALRKAKIKIKETHPDPKYWGSFILIEGKSERIVPMK